MTVSQVEKLGSSSRVEVSCSEGVIRLRDEDLFGEGLGDRCVFFLHHAFTLSEVACVEIDRHLSTAGIHYDTGRLGLPEFLQRLAVALRGSLPPRADALSKSLSRDLEHSTGRVRIQRFGTTLTTWDIIHDRLGRIRLRHQAIRGNPALASQLHSIIENVAGVIKCAVWPVTGSVLIRFNPDLTSAAHLLRILDQARCAPAPPDDISPSPKSAGFGLANTSVALAVTGEVAAPVLLPVCAILLVGSNLGTFRTAGRQLMRGQLGLPIIYTSIVASALVSGQFISCAVMSWMLTLWRCRSRDQMASARRGLLGEILHHPRYVRLVVPNGIDVDFLVDNLRPTDVILVSAGELIPADGRVLEGRGLADEQMVRGVEGLIRKQPDDEVFAGSTLRFGELHIKVLRHGPETRAAALARATLAAITGPHGLRTPARHGEMFAEQTVAPTLAMAGLGLLVGDVTTAGAILAPDYATGPRLAFPLETMQVIALCIRHGIVIRDPEAIECLATADLLILDHHPAFERTELELDAVAAFPGHTEEKLLRYATAAFHDLDDERANVLRSECNARGIALLGLRPTDIATDVTLLDGNDHIKVGDLGQRARGPSQPRQQVNPPSRTKPEPPDSLMVGINGRVAGLIHFRRSNRLEAAFALHRLRSKRNLPVGIVSESPDPILAPLSASLGADFHLGSQSADDRIHFLQYCRRRGFKVAYIGDCRASPRAAAEAHVAISVVASRISDLDLDHDPAPIWLLEPRLAKLGEIWDIAHIHRQRLKVAHRYTLIPNVLCVAGAFVWGFTSLMSVMVTNLAIYGTYSRTAGSIRSLEHQIAKSLKTRQSGSRKTVTRAKSQKDNGG
jgi:cation transport ATPase